MNLYVHFPFCRRKCRYCALFSRVGVPSADRDAYVRRLAAALRTWGLSPSIPRGLSPSIPRGLSPSILWGQAPIGNLKTVYFGGGSPALCDLRPLFAALAPHLTSETEFTVELHPLDVTDDLLATLRDGGVNRVSMGVQSLDDATLAAMGRGYTVDEAARAFARVKRFFDNAGIDLIVGYPGDPCADFSPLADWGLCHCSAYSLQNERNIPNVPDDDWTLDRLRETAAFLSTIGLERYEISNYAVPGRACRHNLAVWRGEDYLGLGEGAYGRLGRFRTRNLGACPHGAGPVPTGWGLSPEGGACPHGAGPVPTGRGLSPEVEEVSAERDALERRIFRLRTRDGLEVEGHPEWGQALERHCETGLLTRENAVYRLTERGMEVCDTILSDLV